MSVSGRVISVSVILTAIAISAALSMRHWGGRSGPAIDVAGKRLVVEKSGRVETLDDQGR
ncbi:MAG: hypothetical protein ACRD1V_09035 [Vicinamibacterales bacterium]